MQESFSIKSIPTLLEVNHRTVQENESGMWYWEPLNDAFYYSDSYLSILGYTDEEFPATLAEWYDIMHPDDIEVMTTLQDDFINSAKGGNQYEHLLRIKNKSGTYEFLIITGFVLHRDADQRATRVSGYNIKCERLRQIDHEQQRMKFALQAAEDGIWDWNGATDEVYYSPRYIAMMGYTEEEFPPTLDSWASRVHVDDYESTVAMQLNIVSSPAYGDSFECTYRFLHKDGSWKWILGKGVVTSRDEEGKARRITGVHIDIGELQRAKEELVETLKIDTLTEVRSRYSFEEKLQGLSERDYPISLIYVDTDGLKIINDLLGHAFGDEYLRKVSTMLTEYTREHDSIYRIGGDEFVILMPNTGSEHAGEALNRLKANVKEQNNIDGALFVSFGLATATTPEELSSLTANADRNMYKNKRRNQAERYEMLRCYCLDILKTSNNEYQIPS